MSKGKGKDASPFDPVNLILELQELIAEGKEVLSGLRATHKDLIAERKLIAEMYAKLPANIDDMVGGHIKMRVQQFGKEIEKATEIATIGVQARFDKLFELMTGADKKNQRAGRPSLAEIAKLTELSKAVATLPPELLATLAPELLTLPDTPPRVKMGDN